jgi:hypothetical protein
MNMRGFFALAACGAVLMVGGAALAKDKAPADPNKKICHPVPDSTSRLQRQKICKTAAEWKQEREGSGPDFIHRPMSDGSVH